MKKRRLLKINKRGQNIIEQLLLTAVVIVVVIVFLSPTGIFKGALEDSLNDVMVTGIDLMTQNFSLNTSILP